MKTVFHVSSPDPGDQRHALANAANLWADDAVSAPGDEIVVVANGGGVRMFVEGAAADPEMVAALAERGIAFRACSNALRGAGKTAEDLLEGVEAVPSGVGELARLQSEGFGYVKAP
ncbi:DsrE family protein [Halegenticoccus soli]|uniref:DsrE family protein n=1 Tax=Halegenticoccus soli TaxID=1985678 RepID=UPI000C6E7424|nr:DsrE family protein [Halegenticoccus soli]